MKLIYTTACVAPDNRMIRYLQQSADRFNIPLKPYGISPTATFNGWLDIKVDKMRDAAQGWLADGYTHVFYTDGRDSFFLTGCDEIESKYKSYGSPPYLIATEDRCYPFPEHGEKFHDPGHPWRWLGAGQYMGEIRWMLDMWERLRKSYSGLERENHDQGWLEMGYVNGDLDLNEFVLDRNCHIFQTFSPDGPLWAMGPGPLSTWTGRRIYNSITQSWPCALHCPGGYSDPVDGKYERFIKPVWSRLGWL